MNFLDNAGKAIQIKSEDLKKYTWNHYRGFDTYTVNSVLSLQFGGTKIYVVNDGYKIRIKIQDSEDFFHIWGDSYEALADNAIHMMTYLFKNSIIAECKITKELVEEFYAE